MVQGKKLMMYALNLPALTAKEDISFVSFQKDRLA